MSITFVAYSKKRQFDETNTMELMSYIPFCDGKNFGGFAGVVPLKDFDGWFATAYTFNDKAHHSDDLFAVFEAAGVEDCADAARKLRELASVDVTDAYETAIGVTFVYGDGAGPLRSAFADLQRSNLKGVS